MKDNVMLSSSHKAKRDLLTKMSSIRNTDGGSVVRRNYTYDRLGRPVTRQTLRSGGAMNETFDYDDRSESTRRLAGRLDTSAAFAPKGENCRRLEGRLAKSDRFCPNGVRSREATPQASIDGARPSQLTGATLGEAPYAYSYDNIGNRITAQEDAESVTYETNNLNQYTQIDTDGTAFVPEYDEDGNQTRVRTVTGIWKVQYNAQNRAIRYESEADSTHVITCVYVSQGRRVEKKEEKEGAVISHVRYVYRGYLQVAAYDLLAEGLPSLWQIIWDPSQAVATRPLAIQINGTWYTYGWDLTKNICELYTSSGAIGASYTYTPYGTISIASNAAKVTQSIQWSSEYHDAETGLVYYNYRYYNYRYYNPRDGRWICRDFLLRMDYVFCLDAPTEEEDILGLKSRPAGRYYVPPTQRPRASFQGTPKMGPSKVDLGEKKAEAIGDVIARILESIGSSLWDFVLDVIFEKSTVEHNARKAYIPNIPYLRKNKAIEECTQQKKDIDKEGGSCKKKGCCVLTIMYATFAGEKTCVIEEYVKYSTTPCSKRPGGTPTISDPNNSVVEDYYFEL